MKQRLFFSKLQVHIEDNNNSPHGKFHRFLFPLSGKFPNLNFAPCSLYLLMLRNPYVTQTVSLGYLCLNLERGETGVFAGYKKAWYARAKLLFCKYAVLDLLLFRRSRCRRCRRCLSSLIQVSTAPVYLPPFLSQGRENFVLRVSGFFVKDPIKSVRRRPKISEDAGLEVFQMTQLRCFLFKNYWFLRKVRSFT